MYDVDNFKLVEAKGEEYDTPSHPPLSPVLEMLQMTSNLGFMNVSTDSWSSSVEFGGA